MSALLRDPAAHSHLSFIQGIINRLAGNSANCKTWCVTLVSAIAVLAAEKQRHEAISIAYIPVVFFLFLDAYYLGIERDFRDLYSSFVRDAKPEALFKLNIPDGRCHRTKATIKHLLSFSVAPAYIIIAVALWFCQCALSAT